MSIFKRNSLTAKKKEGAKLCDDIYGVIEALTEEGLKLRQENKELEARCAELIVEINKRDKVNGMVHRENIELSKKIKTLQLELAESEANCERFYNAAKLLSVSNNKEVFLPVKVCEE